MKKTRWMLAATLVLVVSGIGFGLIGAYSKISVSAESNKIPAVISYLPENADIVAYVDVRKLIYSPAYQAFEKEHGNQFTYKLQDFIRETGLDPRQDLDSVAFAGGMESGRGSGVAIITGRYDQEKITTLMLSKGRAGTVVYRGHKLFTNPNKAESDVSQEVATFLDGTHMVFGHLKSVQDTLDVFSGARQGLVISPAFQQLLSQTRTDGTFWAINSTASLLGKWQSQTQNGEADAIRQSIPPIQNFIIDGDLGNIVTASLRSQCADEKAAQNLGDFARGLVALGKMMTSQRTEMTKLQGLFDDIRITQTKTLVSVEFSIPFEDLKQLQNMENRQSLGEAIKIF